MKQATAAMLSASLVAKELAIWTSSKSGRPRGVATVVTFGNSPTLYKA